MLKHLMEEMRERAGIVETQQMSLLAPGGALAGPTDKAKGSKAEREMLALMHKAPGLTKAKPNGQWSITGTAKDKSALKQYLGQWDKWATKYGLKFHTMRRIMGQSIIYGGGPQMPVLEISVQPKEDGSIFVYVLGDDAGSSRSQAFSRHSATAKKPPVAATMR